MAMLDRLIERWNTEHPFEMILPSRFWQIDGKGLNAEAKRTKGVLKIPGAKIEARAKLITRTR